MTTEKIAISPENKSSLIRSIDELIGLFKNEENLKFALTTSNRKISSIQNSFRTIADFDNTPENRFLSYIMWDMLKMFSTIASNCIKEEWYQENKDTLFKVKDIFVEFLENSKNGLDDESFDQLVQHSKTYFYKTYDIAQRLSAFE